MAHFIRAKNFLRHRRTGRGCLGRNIWAWLFFEGVYVGLTEEIPFRGLLVTYLTAT
jgi:hypothetical protein